MSLQKLPSLSVFFPCYNEEKNIPKMVKKLREVLPLVAKKYEIIIVEDGSTDKSAKVADALAAQDKLIRVIHHAHNMGYGMSLRSGIAAARYQWIFFTDGDLQFDLRELETFIPYVKDASVIIGYRLKRAEGKTRAFNAWLFKQLINMLFGIYVKDIDCAFKLIKTELLQSLPLQSSGACISAEFLYRLKCKGYTFIELPVHHYPRKYGVASGNKLVIIQKALWETLRLFLSLHLTKENAV